jgi:hypothetical protein
MPHLLLCQLPLVVCILIFLQVPLAHPNQHDAGPQIIVLSPHEGDTVTAPFDLEIRFLASSDAHIDTETLKVEVKKMMWGVDVTEQIRGGPGNSDSVISGSLAEPTPPKGGEPEERGDEENETKSRCGIQGPGGLSSVQGRQDAG